MARAARAALDRLLAYTGSALAAGGYDAAVLDPKAARWAQHVAEHITPAVAAVFHEAFDAATRGGATAGDFATLHLATVENRLVGVPDEVFDLMRGELATGRAAGEAIPQLAARVDALLGDDERWANRANTIARTEVIGANNMGGRAAAGATADLLGVEPGGVVKSWLATGDGRTRETHAEADGQQVLGLETPFTVGGSLLDVPGDPAGDAAEVINCRCTATYSYPGDSDYPTDLSAGRGPAAASTNVVDGPFASTPAAPVPVAAQAPLEHPVDPGPQTARERAARSATPEELSREASTATGSVRATARAELRRRGLAAAGRTQEDTMAEDDNEQTGVVVVALPAADDPVQGIGPEQKHATLLYFGDVDGGDNPNPLLTDDLRTQLSAGIAAAAEAHDAGTMDVSGVESLGDEGARVWMLTGDLLAGLRQAVLDTGTDVSDALTGVEQYPTFTPHVTIGYPADPDEATEDETAPEAPEPPETDVAPALDDATEAAAAAVESITFDRLALWWAGEQTEWPLATAPQEAPMDTPAQASGATDTFAVPAPGDAPAGGPELARDIAADGPPLHGILWPEGVMSGDGRMIAEGATVWRDLPLPFMAQDAQAMGHDGAVRTGRIDTITRDTTSYSVPVIRYTGVWDTSPAAIETSRQVANKVARGVSVDGDDVTVELRDSSGNPLDPMVDDFPEDGVVVEVATAARVAGATLCSIPAFQQAYVANGVYEPGMDEPGWTAAGDPIPSGAVPDDEPMPEDTPVDEPAPVMASAWTLVAGGAHQKWARSDFANPGLTEPTRFTVTDDGRVYGNLAVWGTCHIGIDGICQEPPASATNYAYFATGAVDTDEGLVSVGQLTMSTGHAAMGLRHRPAADHYDNTGTAVADIAIGQDGVGIWFAGRLRPGVTPEQVYAMRAAGAVSGDWREVGGQLELVAALVVNVPGFPIPAPAVAASGGRAVALVASGVVAPAHTPPRGVQDLLTYADVRREALAAVDRRERATAAAGRLRGGRVATARRRLQAQATRDRQQRVAAAAARITRLTREV